MSAPVLPRPLLSPLLLRTAPPRVTWPRVDARPHLASAKRSTDTRRWLPWALAVAVAAVCAVAELALYARFGTRLDLAIFDQAVRSLAQGHAPWSAIKQMNLWGDHFHPAIVAWLPLYWLWDDPRMLLLSQALLVAATTGIIVATAQSHLANRRGRDQWAVLLGLSFAASWGVQTAIGFDVHEVALGLVPLALALRALLESRWHTCAGWSLGLLLVKEDAGLVVLGIAMVTWVMGRRVLAAALALAAVAWTAVATQVIVPALSPHGIWTYGGTLGVDTAFGQLSRAVVMPGTLTASTVILLVASAGLALRSPVALALLPTLGARAISTNESMWTGLYHYNLLLAVIVVVAAIDGVFRGGWGARTRPWLQFAVAVSVVCSPLVGQHLALSDASRVTAAHRAVDAVPAGEPVAATDVFLAQLSPTHPDTLRLKPSLADDFGRPLTVDWVVVDRGAQTEGKIWGPQAIAALQTQGFTVVHDEADVVVLQRR